jgi:hypothetical protein
MITTPLLQKPLQCHYKALTAMPPQFQHTQQQRHQDENTLQLLLCMPFI